MGLDNGIEIRGLTQEHIEHIPPYVKFENKYGTAQPGINNELCYWRKCYSIRNEINSIVHHNCNKLETRINPADIEAIRTTIKNHMDSKYWEANAETIWEYGNLFPHLLQQDINLLWLEDFLIKYPDLEVWWYDSY